MQYCKGECTAKWNAVPAVGNSINKSLLKKCSICSVRIDWAGNFCPCCGTMLSRRTISKPVIEIRRRRYC